MSFRNESNDHHSYDCSHLVQYRSNHKPFQSLKKCLQIKPLGRASVRRLPKEVPRCATCSSLSRPRLLACLTCATISCWDPPHSLHAFSHASSHHGHEIAIDLDRAELFCCICRDQVYDPDFDAVVVMEQLTSTVRSSSQKINPQKKRRVEFRSWIPDSKEMEVIEKESSSLYRDELSSCLPMGLRGLNNLGNTCFMNSVLQALLHTPPLRNYFLSDRHNRYACKKNNAINRHHRRQHQQQSSGSEGSNACLACDMDAAFSAFFSGDMTPYSPAKFLYSWWKHASNLASYEQQDAHEFFISMLDGIHEMAGTDLKIPHCEGNGNCCIAHRVFSGILRSDVICTVCGFTSTTYDPCIDISLELEADPSSIKKGSSKGQCSNGENKAALPNQGPRIPTLVGCLDRFTRPERLGSDQKFLCQNCQIRQEFLKQMSIRKLPLVSCFHIKRFEHSSTRNMSRKVDRYLQFPFSLDMKPYLSSSIMRSRIGNRMFALDSDKIEPSEMSGRSSEFELFAVVTHTGKLDAGHYITYLRLSNQWYKCDDAWITRVGENVVRAAQGYMIFYVQKMFSYSMSENMVRS